MNVKSLLGLAVLGTAGFIGYKKLSSEEESSEVGLFGGGGMNFKGATSKGEAKSNSTNLSGEPSFTFTVSEKEKDTPYVNQEVQVLDSTSKTAPTKKEQQAQKIRSEGLYFNIDDLGKTDVPIYSRPDGTNFETKGLTTDVGSFTTGTTTKTTKKETSKPRVNFWKAISRGSVWGRYF